MAYPRPARRVSRSESWPALVEILVLSFSLQSSEGWQLVVSDQPIEDDGVGAIDREKRDAEEGQRTADSHSVLSLSASVAAKRPAILTAMTDPVPRLAVSVAIATGHAIEPSSGRTMSRP